MQESLRSFTQSLLVALACFSIPFASLGADDSALTKDQIKVFLQTAQVIKEKPSSKSDSSLATHFERRYHHARRLFPDHR